MPGRTYLSAGEGGAGIDPNPRPAPKKPNYSEIFPRQNPAAGFNPPTVARSASAEAHARRIATARFIGPEPSVHPIEGIYESFRYGRNFTIGRSVDRYLRIKNAESRESSYQIPEEEFYENNLDIYGNLEWRPGMTLDSYKQLREWKIEELASQWALENTRGGMGTTVMSLVAGMAGSVSHGVDAAAMFLPTGVGKLAQMGQAGARMSRFARLRHDLDVGFRSGLVTAAWAEPIVYTGQQQIQGDYTLADSALNFAFSPIASGILHAGISPMFRRGTTKTTQELLSREAIMEAVWGERAPIAQALIDIDPEIYARQKGVVRLRELSELLKRGDRFATDAELDEAAAILRRFGYDEADAMAADPFRRPRASGEVRNNFNRAWAEANTRAPKDAVELNVQAMVNAIDPNVKVRFYDGVYEVNAHGAVLPRTPDTIYIARQRVEDMTYVAGHEFAHSMKWRAPELWKQVIDVIDKSAAADPVLRDAIRKAVSIQGDALLRLHPAKRLDEAYANVMGDVFNSPAFWRELHRSRPDAFTRIVNWLKDAFRRIHESLRGADADSARYAEKMQAEIAKILATAGEIGTTRSSFWDSSFARGREFIQAEHALLFDMDRWRGEVSPRRIKSLLAGERLSPEQRLELRQALDDAHYEYGPVLFDAVVPDGEWKPRMREVGGETVHERQDFPDMRLSESEIDNIRSAKRKWAESQPHMRRKGEKGLSKWVEDQTDIEITRAYANKLNNYRRAILQNQVNPETRAGQGPKSFPDRPFTRWPMFVDKDGNVVNVSPDHGNPWAAHEIRFFEFEGGRGKAIEDTSGTVESVLRYGKEDAYQGQGSVFQDPGAPPDRRLAGDVSGRILARRHEGTRLTKVGTAPRINPEDILPAHIQGKLREFMSVDRHSQDARRLWGDLLDEPEFEPFYRWLSAQPRHERIDLLRDPDALLSAYLEDQASLYRHRLPDTSDVDFDPFFMQIEQMMRDAASRGDGPVNSSRILEEWRKFLRQSFNEADMATLQKAIQLHVADDAALPGNRPWMRKFLPEEEPGQRPMEMAFDPNKLDDPTSRFDEAEEFFGTDLEADVFRDDDPFTSALQGVFDYRPLSFDPEVFDPAPIARGGRRGRFTDASGRTEDFAARVAKGDRMMIDDDGNLVLRRPGEADNTYRWTEDTDRSEWRRDRASEEADLMAARPDEGYGEMMRRKLNEILEYERSNNSRPVKQAAARIKELKDRAKAAAGFDPVQTVDSRINNSRIADFALHGLTREGVEKATPELPIHMAGKSHQDLIVQLNGRYHRMFNYHRLGNMAIETGMTGDLSFDAFRTLVNNHFRRDLNSQYNRARREKAEAEAKKKGKTARVPEEGEPFKSLDDADLERLFYDLRALHTRHRGDAKAMGDEFHSRMAQELATSQLAAMNQFSGMWHWRRLLSKGGISAIHSKLDGAFRPRVKGMKGLGNNVFTSNRQALVDYSSAFIAVLQKNDAWAEFRQNKEFTRGVVEFMETGQTADPRAREVGEALRLIWDNLHGEMRAQGSNMGYLSDFAFSQSWDRGRVKGVDFNTWKNEMLDALDWDRMVQHNGRLGTLDSHTGRIRFFDKEAYLHSVYEDISNGHWRERDNLDFEIMGGNIARQMEQNRTLIFKPGRAFEMDMKYGSGNTGQAIISQIARKAELASMMRTIAPDLGRFRRDMINILDGRQAQTENLRFFEKIIDPTGSTRFKWIFDKLTGSVDRPENAALGKFGKSLRQLADMGVLGQSTVTAFSMDPMHMADQLRFMGMPLMDAYSNLSRATAAAAKRKARLDNLDADAMLMGHAAGLDAFLNAGSRRVGGEITEGSDLISRAHARFFDVQGMNAWNTIGQQATVDVTQRWFGDMAIRVREGKELPPQFVNALERFDISPDEFRAMAELAKEYPFGTNRKTSADQASWLDGPRIVKDDIADLDLRRKYGNFLDEAMRFGILEPTVTESAYLHLGLQAGTVPGEAMRFITKYMNFPLAVGRKTYRRMLNGYGEDGLRELSSMGMTQGTIALMQFVPILLMGSATALGIKDILAGRDPIGDMTPQRMARILSNSGALWVFPELYGLAEGDLGLAPPVGSAANLVTGAATADPYRMSNAVMDTIPGNNLPLINEAKKAMMATIFEDWYGTNFEARLQYFERTYGTSSIFQQ